MRDVELFILTGIIVTLILIAFIVSFLLINQKRYYHHLKEKREIQMQFQQELLNSQLEIQEQTLKNVSQEIHDNIGQVLSLVKLNINTMNCDVKDELQHKISDSNILISKAIQDLRHLSRSLNTDYVLELGFVRSVEYELELIKKTGRFETHFRVDGRPYQLEAQKELILFRIMQEALHNVIKHSSAKEISVQMKFKPETFTLSIEDNGVGINKDLSDRLGSDNTGSGIRNMRNRAKLVKAKLNIVSSHAEGTSIIVTLPLDFPKL